MPSLAEEIESVALQLPREQRAHLAERLIASLDEDAEVEQAWAAEIRRRVEELRSGAVQVVPGDEVFRDFDGGQCDRHRPGSPPRRSVVAKR